MAKDKALTGAAGAYYIAFRLSVEGYAVGLTNYGTRAIDLIVANPDTGKPITIQAKTMKNALVHNRKSGDYCKWRVAKKLPPAHEAFFYTFVGLKDQPTDTPEVFVVPSQKLTSLLEEHPGDPWCVINEKDWPKYQNRWDLIEAALA